MALSDLSLDSIISDLSAGPSANTASRIDSALKMVGGSLRGLESAIGVQSVQSPAAAIGSASSSPSKIQYPPDLPPYYFKMEMYEYSRVSWNQVGTTSLQAVLTLPVPMNLIDAQTVDWEGQELGTVVGGVFGASAQNLIGTARGTVTAEAMEIGSEALGTLGQGVSRGAQVAVGVAINNYITMMLKGPTYKEHSFTWVFSPETAAESQTISAIYRLLSAAQAVSISSTGGSAFFDYPSVFGLSFQHSSLASSSGGLGKLLYKMKPSVLKSAVWNFAPQGAPAFFAASKAPQSVAVQLNFCELEYWLRDDYVALSSSTKDFMP